MPSSLLAQEAADMDRSGNDAAERRVNDDDEQPAHSAQPNSPQSAKHSHSEEPLLRPPTTHPFVHRYFYRRGQSRSSHRHLRRLPEEVHAMRPVHRVWVTAKKHCGKLWTCFAATETSVDSSGKNTEQYRIPPREEKGNAFVVGFGFLTEGNLIGWTLWHYRTTFVHSMLAFLLVYFAFSWIFAFFIRWTVNAAQKGRGVDCLTGWDYDDTAYLGNYNRAYELSWTTISTVGFGTIHVPVESQCLNLRIILAVEAFTGVLYIGFCGAILFAKISRVHATANVELSSIICLQYGQGVSEPRLNMMASMETTKKMQGPVAVSEDHSGNAERPAISANPFIELRVVNRRANIVGGEISDAKISCVASSVRFMRSRNTVSKGVGQSTLDFDDKVDFDDIQQVFDGRFHNDSRAREGKKCMLPNIKRAFQQVQLTPDSHPHFAEGSWYLRHTLDQYSPLLKPSIRRVVREIGGWPTYLNDHDKIRKCLAADIFSLGIIFSGTSNMTASSCFKTYEYKMEDIYIGWRFVPIAYVDSADREDDSLKGRQVKFDHSLVHDIIPQHGGGAEPLGDRDSEHNLLKFLVKKSGRIVANPAVQADNASQDKSNHDRVRVQLGGGDDSLDDVQLELE